MRRSEMVKIQALASIPYLRRSICNMLAKNKASRFKGVSRMRMNGTMTPPFSRFPTWVHETRTIPACFVECLFVHIAIAGIRLCTPQSVSWITNSCFTVRICQKARACLTLCRYRASVFWSLYWYDIPEKIVQWSRGTTLKFEFGNCKKQYVNN